MPSEPARDRGRPLTRLEAGAHSDGIWVDPIYRRWGYAEALPEVWLREAVVPFLRRAALAVDEAGHGLLLWDGWRSDALQRTLYEEYRARIVRDSELAGAELDAYVALFVTDPDRRHPPPAHSTGGAIDLTLCDRATGEPLDMGGDFDELGPRSEAAYYDDATDGEGREFARRRRILHDAMADAGFVRLPSEWWHFEHGTALWANARGDTPKFTATPGPEPS